MKLAIASGGNREQHFSVLAFDANSVQLQLDMREIVIPPFTQVTAPEDLSAAQIADVTSQLRSAGFITLAEVNPLKPYPGSYSFA